MQKPIFNSTEQAVTVMFSMQARLAALVMWLLVALVHIGLLAIASILVWAFQIQPTEVLAWSQELLQSMPVSVLTAVGVSFLSLLGAYLWVLRWVHAKVGSGWLVTYLLKGSVPT